MQVSFRKLAVAVVTATALAFGSMNAAQAAWGGHGHWGGGHWGGGYWGGWGVGAGVLGGLALGTALSAPYWGGYGYAPYVYAPYEYDYGPACYIRRRVVIDRFGYRHIRRVQVCY